MMDWIKLLVLVLNTLINLFCIFLLVGGGRYEELLTPLILVEFPFKETYTMGIKWNIKRKYRYASREDKKFRKEIYLLYGDKYVEYYLHIVHARRFSLSVICMAIFSNLACLSRGKDALVTFIVGGVISGTVYYHYSTNNGKLIKERTEQYLSDFPDVCSKLALLVNAGMILREAWDKVAYSKSTSLYKQMQITSEDIKNGNTEYQAYYGFGLRTVSGEIRKFSAMIIQGIEKGNKELAYGLATLSSEMWEMRKQDILKQGALASGKLMFPMVIMFIGIMVMVLVPIFTNLGF